jgi:hypothetical protein
VTEPKKNVSVTHVNIVKLTLGQKRTVIPSDLILEINMYEGIFENTITGNIVLQDAAGLLSDMPLKGEEYFEIEYNHDSERSVNKKFYVYKLDQKTITSKRSIGYVLHFISKEAIISSNLSISETFNGRISKIVEYIFTNSKLLNANDQRIFIEDTKNSYKLIPPFWSPFKIINWLSSKALNKNGTPNYLFFETSQSYEFVSAETLIAANPVKNYYYADSNASTTFDDDAKNDLKSCIVSNVWYNIQYDYIKRLKSGMLASELNVLDIINKKVITTDYNYIRDFKKTTHMSKFPLHTEEVNASKNAKQVFVIENNFLYGKKQNKQQHTDTVLQNLSLMEQLNAHKITIEVPGSLDVKAGSVIDLTLPEYNAFGKEEKRNIKEKYYTGKYLVTSIHHNIVGNFHTMYMEVVKDSVAEQLKENVK